MTEKKKLYEAPQMKVQQMKPESIICVSDPQFTTEQLVEEEYTW